MRWWLVMRWLIFCKGIRSGIEANVYVVVMISGRYFIFQRVSVIGSDEDGNERDSKCSRTAGCVGAERDVD